MSNRFAVLTRKKRHCYTSSIGRYVYFASVHAANFKCYCTYMLTQIYIILNFFHIFSYVNIKPAKRLQRNPARTFSSNDIIIQSRYVSIPHRLASWITRSTASYRQTCALVLPNHSSMRLYYITYLTHIDIDTQ